MSKITVQAELVYRVIIPSSFVLNIAPAITDHQQIVDENLSLSPQYNCNWCDLNLFGSRGIRLNAQPGDMKISYSANVSLIPGIDFPNELGETEYTELPVEVLPFLNPSRYCESDQLGQFAWNEFGGTQSGHSRVEAITYWVNKNISYVAGTTNMSSSARDVLIQRTGVCRDFAHVSIALCRAMGIPARYVSGYSVGLEPPDFHGFFEVYLQNRWYLFDATKMAPVSGFVRIGVGRDAADASFSTVVGQVELQSISVLAKSNQEGDVIDSGEGAFSTA